MVRGPVSLWSILERWSLNPYSDRVLIPLQGFSPTPQAAYRDVSLLVLRFHQTPLVADHPEGFLCLGKFLAHSFPCRLKGTSFNHQLAHLFLMGQGYGPRPMRHRLQTCRDGRDKLGGSRAPRHPTRARSRAVLRPHQGPGTLGIAHRAPRSPKPLFLSPGCCWRDQAR